MALDPRLYIAEVSNLPRLGPSASPDLVALRESIARELTELRRALRGNVDIGLVGPAASTDNAIVLWDGTTGTATKNSLVTIDANGRINFSVNNQAFGTSVANGASNVGWTFQDTIVRTLGDHFTVVASTGTVIFRQRAGGGGKALIWGTGGSNYVQCDFTGLKFGVNATGTGTPQFSMTNVIPLTSSLGIQATAGFDFAVIADDGAAGFLYFPVGGNILEFWNAAFVPAGGINPLGQLFTLDTSAAFFVTLAFTSSPALAASRTLTFDLANVARTITLSGNPTLADWFNQNVKTTANVTFNDLATTGNTTIGNATTDTVRLNAGGNAAAPATNAIGVLLDYYGTSATRALTTPNRWQSIIGDDGNTYKIPLYS